MNGELQKNRCFSDNIGKTNYVIFGDTKTKSIALNISVLFDAKPLKCVNVAKFLVIFIDENHSWKFLSIMSVATVWGISRSRFVLSTILSELYKYWNDNSR